MTDHLSGVTLMEDEASDRGGSRFHLGLTIVVVRVNNHPELTTSLINY